MKIALTIPGEPKGKARPKFDSRSRRAYTPSDTKKYEKQISDLYHLNYSGLAFPDGALDLRIRAYFGVPKSDSAKTTLRKLANVIRPTKKPDMDNIVKIVADALNGVAFRDDAQIVDCMVRKFYSNSPRVEITIENIKEVNPT